ncbi:MAG: HdeA/HdeB family chaperone [Methylovirgula sp.]
MIDRRQASLWSVLLAVIWLGAGLSGARASTIDLNTESCQDFLNADQAEVATTLAWLDGYYQDTDAPPVIDFDALKTNAAKLKAFCAAYPERTVGAAAESLFGHE